MTGVQTCALPISSSLGYNSGFLKPYDKFKAKVLDIEFITYNTTVYKDRFDSNGNQRFYEDDFSSKSPNAKRKKIKYVYKCKWIVGTDKCYDYGMCYDQVRSTDIKKAAETNLSYIFYAYSFDKMRADGFMKRLKPFLDDYQNTIIKIQNFKNRAVPSGWWIDFSALESVAMQKGGKTMTPMQLLQMFFDTGVLVGRSEDESGMQRNQNWKPVIPIENSVANELAMFANDLMNTRMAIEAITGHNDVTMGQASSKTLVPGYETAQQSTQDSLHPLIFADEQITLRLAEAVLARMKQGVKKGDIYGYAPSINTNTLKYMQIDSAISEREHGIELEKRSTQGEKAQLMEMMAADIQNGYLDSADAITLINTKNVKQAQQMWAFKVARTKKNMQEQELRKLQTTNEGNAQLAQTAQQTTFQTMQMQQDFELKKEAMRIQGELQKEAMRIASQERIVQIQTGGKIHANSETAQAKILSTEIQGNHAQHKQIIANEKPSSSNNN